MTDADKVMHPKHEGTKMYHQVSENAPSTRRRKHSTCRTNTCAYPLYSVAELVMGHFFKTQPNPTQNFWNQPNPTHKSLYPTQPNPSSTLGMAY